MPRLEEERRYLIRVEKRWKLLVLPFLCLVYFAWVLAVGTGSVRTDNVPLRLWVLGGLGLFGFTLFVYLLLLIPLPRRKPKKVKVKVKPKVRGREVVDLAAEASVVDLAFDAPAGAGRARDEEVRVTRELHKGSRVIEVSRPPKARYRGAVYAKAFVPVTDGWVLRVEELVAERDEADAARVR